MNTPPLSWPDVLDAEYRAMYGQPPLDSAAPASRDERLHALHQRLHERQPSALCLSGGGVRSATFALGVLQGLAHIGALNSFNYLSTVSGGGYIGGWFTAWLHRRGAAGRDEVLRTLDPAQAATISPLGVATPVDRVRRTCRYLALKGGIVSADVWTVVTTLVRNLLLNWLVILPLLAAALLIPRFYYGLLSSFESPLIEGSCVPPRAASVFAGTVSVTTVICVAYIVISFLGRGGNWSQARFLVWFLTPLLVGAIALSLFWASYPCPLDLWWSIGLASVVPAIGWLILGNFARDSRSTDGSALHIRPGFGPALAALAAGPVLGLGVYWLGSYPFGFGSGEDLRELYAIFGVPATLGLVLLEMAIFVGLASSGLDDAALEWWSRAGAWIAITASLWIFAGVLVFYVADVIEAGIRSVATALAIDHDRSSAVFAALVPLLSSLAGIAARRTTQDGRPSKLMLTLQQVALPLVIFVLLSSIAWANFRVIEELEYHRPPDHPIGAGLGEILTLGGALIAFGLIMSRFIPANRFSLHGMYQQRLVRTFLGASRDDRRPNAFTGFDGNDDLRVHDLSDVRPLHIINTTLNTRSSNDFGRHDRQAESFTFSPLHVGSQEVGYRRASEYGSDGGAPGSGLSLGMAMAVSGAAASSSLGIYSSPARSFLLTLANARLGLWFGNPLDDSTWRKSEPPLGVGPVMRELLGLTTDHNPYVYLSDGGHYENLALWEMVARRCRFIVVSDAGCDPNYTLADLSNAIRRIRLDLGVPIQFPPIEMSREGQGRSNPHGAIGVIRYTAVDGPNAPDGLILYIKATLSGDEPVDVKNFALGDPAFPHDSTGNQFFDEARFESYRLLGFHSVLAVTRGYAGGSVEALFEAARTALYGQSASTLLSETQAADPRSLLTNPPDRSAAATDRR